MAAYRRVGWLLLAIFFFVSSIGVGALVLWQQTHQPKPKIEHIANFTPVSKVNKLEVKDIKKGSGAAVKPDDNITVNYTGAVASTGIVFDSTTNGTPATFNLNEVILGWRTGLVGMQIGGQRRLLIPTALAYGPNPPPNSTIPVNADLVFDVTLLSVNKKPTPPAQQNNPGSSR